MNPGKYDAPCLAVRLATDAEGVILVVFNGICGSGFSVQWPPEQVKAIPAVLREIADSIEAEQQRLAKN